jgi:hypothetical protein
MTANTAGFMGIANLQVDGTVFVTATGGSQIIYGCNITATASEAVNIISGTVFITECRITNASGAPLSPTVFAQGVMNMRDCVITQNGQSGCIRCTTSATIRQCVVTSTSVANDVEPLIRFINTTGTATTEVSFCELRYTSSTVDVNGNKCCIQYLNSVTNNSTVFNSLLICEGANIGSPNIQCIQDVGLGAVNLSYGQLSAGATAHHISPNVTKTQFVAVP